MFGSLLLIGSLCSAGPDGLTEPIPPLRVERGLEILWKGIASESILRPTKSFRTYDLEFRAFVLDVGVYGADMAILTTLRAKPEPGTPHTIEPPAIVRLEWVRREPSGLLRPLTEEAIRQPAERRMPGMFEVAELFELPLAERGMFPPVPEGERFQFGQGWNFREPGRPIRQWSWDGVETVRGARCLRISAKQADRAGGWNRSDIALLSTTHGYAARVERTIERIDPETGDLGFRAKVSYEQHARMVYVAKFATARVDEIKSALAAGFEFDRLAHDPAAGPRDFERLLSRIEQHETSNIAGEGVPYRAALLTIKRRAEAAKNGNLPPASGVRVVAKPATFDGPLAPFTTSDLLRGGAIDSEKFLGKPTLIVYFQPSKPTADPILKTVQALADKYPAKVRIIVLALGETETAKNAVLRAECTLPVGMGNATHKLHGIVGTPAFLWCDRDGNVVKTDTGWGTETAGQLNQGFLERSR